MSAFPSDSALPRAVVAGLDASDSSSAPLADEVAALFDQLQRPLLRYLLACRLPAPDGEEVVQDVFLALHEHLRAGKPRYNLRGWIFRVAHNLALKRHYAARDRLRQFPGERACAEHTDPAPGPEDQLCAQQRQQRLLAVVAALPERDRCCLCLRAEGLRYREIGETLGMSLGSVAASLARSLERLARADGV